MAPATEDKMKKARPAISRWRKWRRFLLYTCCALIVLVIAAIYALTLPSVQRRLTNEAETYLQKKLGTRVEVGAIRLRFPYYVSLEDFLLEDQQGDTLARIGSLILSIKMWELLDQTIRMEKITLEDASIFLHQKDSTYNYDFIVAAFAKPEVSTPVDTTASPWKLELDLSVLQLTKVDFLLQDDDSKMTTQAKIGTADTKIIKADLKALQFDLSDLQLADSDIRVIQEKMPSDDSKPATAITISLNNSDIVRSHLFYSTPEQEVNATLVKTQINEFRYQSLEDFMSVQAKGVRIENSAMTYRDPEIKRTPGHFNAGDMDITRLNAIIPDFSFQNDTLSIQATSLSGTDKSGLLLHSMSGIALVSPGSVKINNALARVNRTILDGDIWLRGNNENIFNHMQVQLRNVKGIIGDLIVLLPPQDNPALSRLQDIPYEVSGKLTGWLENLQTENIRLRAGSSTVAHFSGSVQQLTEVEKLGMRLNISRLESNRADLIRWMSVGDMSLDSLLAMPLPAFVSTSGTVEGTMSSLQLALRGEISALQSGSAFLAVEGPPMLFDLAGTLTQVNNPDLLGMDIQVHRLDAPRNFFTFMETPDLQFPDMLQVNGNLQGTLAALQSDLQFNALRGGSSSQLAFKGMLNNVRTPDQLGFDVTLKGNISRQELLGYVADTLVTQVLRLPDFVQVDGEVRGTVKDAIAKFSLGLNGLGKIFLDGNLHDSTYQVDLAGQNLQISKLAVDTSLQSLKTMAITAHINGEGFQFGETARIQMAGKVDSLIWDNLILRDIALDANIDGRRFTGGFQSPDERAAVTARVTGDFSTGLSVLDTDINLNCLDLREFGWSSRPTIMCMHITSHSEGISLDTLTAVVNIENIDLQYDTVHVYPGDLVLDIKLDNNHNNINIASDWLRGEIKGYFELSDLSETIANITEQYIVVDRTAYLPPVGTDSLAINLRLLEPELLTTGLIPGLTALGQVNLEGILVAERNFFNLIIQAPLIGYRDWEVDSLNVRSYAGDTAAMFIVSTPLVKRGEETFVEKAVLNGQFQANIADISFNALNEGGRERFLLAARGLFNKEKEETLISLSPRLIIDQHEWTINDKNQLQITPAGVTVREFELSGNGQSIKVEGSTKNLKGNITGLDFVVDIDRIDYNNLDIFLEGLLSELGGWADAHLKISGTTVAPQLLGQLQFHETFFTPVETNVRYELSETPLVFTKSGLSLDGLTLRDPYGKTLDIKGRLTTTDWINIESNLTLHAERWQVLNSTKQQNPLYFGELYISLDGTVRGPISQPDIRVVVKSEKESSFTYVYDEASMVQQHEGIVYFLPPPRKYVRPEIYDAPVSDQSFTLSASVEIDSNLTINSVINPVTGDDFRGKATGKLQLDIFSNGNMTLTGQVELVRGVYNYSYQSVVKRSFEVTSGSTILWTGDINSPELSLKARYQFRTSPYPLVVNQLASASPEEIALYRKPQTFYLQTTLNGPAAQPDISFQFIYPEAGNQGGFGANPGNQESILVESALGNVNQDKNLLSRQVFGVLLLRNFIGETVGTTSIVNGSNPLKSGLSNFLTGQINALADQYLTWIDIDLVTTEGSTANGSSQPEGATNYQLRLQKSFFEDRLTFKISGGTTVGGGTADGVQSGLDNASIEYALTPKGEFKVTLFSEKGFELLNASSSNLRNSGAGLIFSREFGGKKKKE